jgi:hypothetical protein
MRLREAKIKEIYSGLRYSDKAVFKYLCELIEGGDGNICTASIPKIAIACDISERQVQISAGRLIKARLIKRVGYVFSNPDRSRRGTIYKLPSCKHKAEQQAERVAKKSTIKFLLFWSEDNHP